MWKIKFHDEAVIAFKAFDHQIQRRIKAKLLWLAKTDDPTQHVKLLTGSKRLKGLYRLRVGDVRIIFRLENQEYLILVLTLGKRSEIYNEKRIKMPL